jgi:hypothetical protein
MITWQELAEALPEELQSFLAEKYGIATGNSGLSFDSSAGSDDLRPWI